VRPRSFTLMARLSTPTIVAQVAAAARNHEGRGHATDQKSATSGIGRASFAALVTALERLGD
jgi:hypothetical protein